MLGRVRAGGPAIWVKYLKTGIAPADGGRSAPPATRTHMANAPSDRRGLSYGTVKSPIPCRLTLARA